MLAAALTLCVAGATTPVPAGAADELGRVIPGAGEQRTPLRYDRPPPGWRLTAAQAVRIATAEPALARALNGDDTYARAYLKPRRHWQVSVFDPPARPGARTRELAQALVRDNDGRVLEAWTGLRVDWIMARGYPGAFGRSAGALWIWLPLCVLFLLPFLRRPLRLLHLDLLVLLSFSVSFAFFSAGAIEMSVPLAYPPLAYLLVRMLMIAARASRRGEAGRPLPLATAVPDGWLALGIVFMLAFRVALNVVDSTVIDVGYAGVIGADRLTDGVPLYGSSPPDNPRGDTYGPLAYYAYVPWELALPWGGTWDRLPAAHAAAISFDLAAVAVLWLLGRAVRGPRLGLLLAYLWCAFPFTLLALTTNANDGLPAVLVGLTLVALPRPWLRGVAVAAAALTKFAPLVLLPLVATYCSSLRPGARAGGPLARRYRAAAITIAAFSLAAVAVMLPVAADGGLERFWSRTFAFQADRGSPFSLWGLYGLEGIQPLAALAAVALAVLCAIIPRRRDVVVVAALSAAALIGVQLALEHWFYTYVVWWLAPAWVALLAPYVLTGPGGAPVTAAPAAGSAGSPRRGAAATRV